jgi:hypothetical protein
MDENPEEVVEVTDSTEEVVLEEETTDDIEDIAMLKTRLEEVEEAKRQLTARAHRAEAEAKALRAKPKPASQEVNNTLSADDVDTKILQSQGMSDDLIAELKALATVRGKSILATQLDPIFIAIKAGREAEEKNAKASLGASRGSGQNKPKKNPSTPGLSDEEHKELWRKSQEA